MIIRHVLGWGFSILFGVAKGPVPGEFGGAVQKRYPHGSNNNLFLALWAFVKLEACFCCSVMYVCIVEWRVIITTMYYYLLSRRKSLVMGTERTMDGHYGATNFNFA